MKERRERDEKITHIPRQEVAETPVILLAVEQVLYF